MVESTAKELLIASTTKEFDRDDTDPEQQLEKDILIKPRTHFTSQALKNVVPRVNLKKKRESISMSLTSFNGGAKQSQLFQSQSLDGYCKRVKSLNFVPKQLCVHSPRGSKMLPTINEPIADPDESSEVEDTSSSDESSDEYDMDGEENEDKLYQNVLQVQKNASALISDPDSAKEKSVESLVDKDTKALLNACSMLKQPSEEELHSKRIFFGERTRLKTLILDMDETMIHSKFYAITPADLKQQPAGGLTADANGCLEFNILIAGTRPDGTHSQEPQLRLNVKVRQHLEEVMQYLATMYELVVFTAGEQDYADTILDYIDADRSVIKHRMYRQHCVKPSKGIYIKDLRVIADRDLKDILIVDNSIVSFAFQISNGIPIAAFVGDKNDEELLYLTTFLEEIFSKSDVRAHIDKTFKLKAMMNELSQKSPAKQKAKSDQAEKDLKVAAQSLHAKDKEGKKEIDEE